MNDTGRDVAAGRLAGVEDGFYAVCDADRQAGVHFTAVQASHATTRQYYGRQAAIPWPIFVDGFLHSLRYGDY